MKQYAFLLEYFEKQTSLIKKLYDELIVVDVSIYDKTFLFSLRAQQFYTAIEALFKQIAKSFENHLETMTNFHREMLLRMKTEVPKIRPAVISSQSFALLNKVRAFRDFILHAYDCELDEDELRLVQSKLIKEYAHVENDLQNFRSYIKKLANA